MLEPKVVVPRIWPTTGLKSTASDNSYVPSGSNPPKSTLLGEYTGISLYSIEEYEDTSKKSPAPEGVK